jgi:hypothetical protein
VSLELLLLLAAFVLLPLIQQLLRAAQAREPPTPEPAEKRPPRPPVQAPPRTLAVPPPPGAARDAASDALIARGRTPALKTAGPVTPALTPHRSARRRRAAALGLRNRLDLRRAIVRMAILGPCRAMSPYDWPERAGPSSPSRTS